MSDKKSEKKPVNELDINFAEDTIVILGRIDCPRLTHCRALISNILDKIYAKNMKTHFVICFETQFESLRNYLLKQDLGFIDYTDSPIPENYRIFSNFRSANNTNFCSNFIPKRPSHS